MPEVCCASPGAGAPPVGQAAGQQEQQQGAGDNALHLNFIISLLAPIYGHGLLGNLWS